jgi:co-chaperonin GroES (HSP10)
MNDTIVPMPGYVLVEDVNASELASGIVVAEDESKKSQICKVIDVAALTINDDFFDNKIVSLADIITLRTSYQIEVGQTIIIKKYSANTVEIQGKSCGLVAFGDIIGKVANA